MRQIMLALVALGVTVAAQGPIGTTGTATQATANLLDASGRDLGDARLEQTPAGVLLKLDLRNAPAGVHALHIHAVGKCDAPSFESAGPHFSPEPHMHGFMSARGPHAGDMPNIYVPAAGTLSLEFMIANITLDAGPRSVADTNGSALVMHAGKDDYITDPAGNAGDRFACGPIILQSK